MRYILLLLIILITLPFRAVSNSIEVKGSLAPYLNLGNIEYYHYYNEQIYVSCHDGIIRVFDEKTLNLDRLFKFEQEKKYGISDFLIIESKLITNPFIFDLESSNIIDSLRLDVNIERIIKFNDKEIILLEFTGSKHNILKYNLENHSYDLLYTSNDIANMAYIESKGFYILHGDGKLQRYDDEFKVIKEIQIDNLGSGNNLKTNEDYLLLSYTGGIKILDIENLSQIHEYDNTYEFVQTGFSRDKKYFLLPINKGGGIVEYQIKDLNNNTIDKFSLNIGLSSIIIFKDLNEIIVLSEKYNSFIFDLNKKEKTRYLTLFSSDKLLAYQDIPSMNKTKEYLVIEGSLDNIIIRIFDEYSNIIYENYFPSQYRDEYFYDYYPVEQTENEILFPVANGGKNQIIRIDKQNYSTEYLGSFEDIIIDMDFDKNTNTLALGGYGSKLYVYDCKDYKEMLNKKMDRQIVNIKNKDGRVLLGEGGKTCYFTTYDFINDEYKKDGNIYGKNNWYHSELFKFSDNGNWLVLYKNGIELINTNTLNSEYKYEHEDIRTIKNLDVSSSGEILLSTSNAIPKLLNSKDSISSDIYKYIKKSKDNEIKDIKGYFNTNDKRILLTSFDPFIMNITIDSRLSNKSQPELESIYTKRIIGNVIPNVLQSSITDLKVYDLIGNEFNSLYSYSNQEKSLTFVNLPSGIFVVKLGKNKLYILLNTKN